MGIKARIAVAVGSATLAIAMLAPAASAAQLAGEPNAIVARVATVANSPAAALAGTTRAKGFSPIRECFRDFCDEVTRTIPDEKLRWTKFAINQEGNRWYYVHTTDGLDHDGWIYCGNVTERC